MTGNIRDENLNSPIGGGVHALSQIDESIIPSCANDTNGSQHVVLSSPAAPSASVETLNAPASTAENPAETDVLVAFMSAAHIGPNYQKIISSEYAMFPQQVGLWRCCHMNKYVWSLAAVWALSLAACGDDKPKEKLCEKGNTSCEVAEDKNEVGFIAEPEIPFGWFEVGNGKCVVGYDGDCEIGQVCLSSKGTQKDLQGVCTDGQWDTNGKLVAVMLFETLIQDERRVGSMSYFGGRSEECFWACSMASVIFLWRGIGMAPATVTARIQGPNAQAEQLRASARGVEYGCVKANSTLEGRQQWTCSFPKEGWA
ncbi:MAG: hypothetical protein FWC28_00015, partial [Proteobacteria bacterium]|nr:hypothetical protein [Pseudomonadota bacterium]